jgi:hypothetical protein
MDRISSVEGMTVGAWPKVVMPQSQHAWIRRYRLVEDGTLPSLGQALQPS